MLNLRQDQVHGFQLCNTERTPAPAKKADYNSPFVQQIRGGDLVAIVIGKLESRRSKSNADNILSESLPLQLGNNAGVNPLSLCGNIPGN